MVCSRQTSHPPAGLWAPLLLCDPLSLCLTGIWPFLLGPKPPSLRRPVSGVRSGGRREAGAAPGGDLEVRVGTRQPASLCRLARGCEVSPVAPSPAAELGPASRRGLPLGALGWVAAPPSLPSPGCPRLPRARGPSAGRARPIGKRHETPAKVLKSLLGREAPSGTPLVGLSSSDRPFVQGTRYQRIGFSA